MEIFVSQDFNHLELVLLPYVVNAVTVNGFKPKLDAHMALHLNFILPRDKKHWDRGLRKLIYSLIHLENVSSVLYSFLAKVLNTI